MKEDKKRSFIQIAAPVAMTAAVGTVGTVMATVMEALAAASPGVATGVATVTATATFVATLAELFDISPPSAKETQGRLSSLLALFPAHIRDEYGPQLALNNEEKCLEALKKGKFAYIRTVVTSALSMLFEAVVAHWESRSRWAVFNWFRIS